jgi:hypothetical protein
VQAPQLALDVLEVVDAQLFEPQQLPIQPEIEDVEEEGEEEGEEKEDQVAVPHSLTGIITTVGAIALFTIIAIFFASCDTKIEKMRETPGKIAFQNVGKLQTMRRVGSFIALSSGLTGIFWAGFSVWSRTKKLFSITGCIANCLLVVWILFLW